MERLTDMTRSQARTRAIALSNGRGRNQAYTSGARPVSYKADNLQADISAWNEHNSSRNPSTGRFKKKGTGGNRQMYGRSVTGRMSANGRTAGGVTHSFTKKDSEGTVEAQSGRGGLATRRQRYYDVRVGLAMAGG